MVDGTSTIASKFATPEKLRRSSQEILGPFYKRFGAFAMNIAKSLKAIVGKAVRNLADGIAYVVFYETNEGPLYKCIIKCALTLGTMVAMLRLLLCILRSELFWTLLVRFFLTIGLLVYLSGYLLYLFVCLLVGIEI